MLYNQGNGEVNLKMQITVLTSPWVVAHPVKQYKALCPNGLKFCWWLHWKFAFGAFISPSFSGSNGCIGFCINWSSLERQMASLFSGASTTVTRSASFQGFLVERTVTVIRMFVSGGHKLYISLQLIQLLTRWFRARSGWYHMHTCHIIAAAKRCQPLPTLLPAWSHCHCHHSHYYCKKLTVCLDHSLQTLPIHCLLNLLFCSSSLALTIFWWFKFPLLVSFMFQVVSIIVTKRCGLLMWSIDVASWSSIADFTWTSFSLKILSILQTLYAKPKHDAKN